MFVVYYAGLYVTTGVACYGVLSYTQAVDIGQVIDYLQLREQLDIDLDGSAGNLVAAVAVNEGLEVLRLPFALLTTPMLARALRGEQKA